MIIHFAGLGSMGSGMAASCLRAGHEVHGTDPSAERLAALVAAGGQARGEGSPASDIAVSVVLNAEQSRAAIFGEGGLASRLAPGGVILGCATVAPAFAREMEAEAQAMGLHYLDAPISGGAGKAAAGQLTIMAAGTPDAFAAARPALNAMAETVFELGDHAGPASAMKAVNQLLAGVHIATMAEAMTFAMTQGITPETFLEVIPRCAGTSWMLENRAPHIATGDYTPHSQVNIWPKDLGIVLDIARNARFSAPITAAALQQYLAAAGMGLGHEDDSAVVKVYARNAGLTLPGEG
ncbi:3-hydroxyisobutyrate dehydrogenase [Roseibium aquae]|uniref:L-threonate dehydrogenase n=1 Tax=Roseibium aquae TaxID=1323746 RepID=A0A916WYI2_9HYPH|nr:L-threonate dehydrogenase [Roseibium aquae]GGB43745.1 3-hydroxyisobutyrate dehydrogenase [Roseibium aquae]